MARHVTVRTELSVPVTGAGRCAVSLAVAATPRASDALTVVGENGRPLPVREVSVCRQGRMHVIDAPEGRLRFTYDATVSLSAGEDEPVTAEEELVYRRASRYCPSDRLGGLAVAEFGWAGSPGAVAHGVARWLYEHVSYTAGSTDVEDDALAPLVTRHGVCRDFAHLGIALCRSMGIPARYASVYAPGLDPMDVHAVFEAAVGGRWLVFDGTMLAPRDSLVRIATGRDAADAALLTPLGAALEAPAVNVTATVDPELPEDDHRRDVVLA